MGMTIATRLDIGDWGPQFSNRGDKRRIGALRSVLSGNANRAADRMKGQHHGHAHFPIPAAH